jgi:polygalacturonase
MNISSNIIILNVLHYCSVLYHLLLKRKNFFFLLKGLPNFINCYLILAMQIIVWTGSAQDNFFNVRDYGAIGDGKTSDSEAIRSTVNACAGSGGGIIYFPAGTYLSGCIVLQDNTGILLDAGATLLAHMDSSDYRIMPLNEPPSLIVAIEKENIWIGGKGTIDGNGKLYTGFPEFRVHLLYFKLCHGITVQNVTLKEATTWIQHYFNCDNVLIDGITVQSRINPDIETPRFLPGKPGRNEDGLDINGCHNVRISNCYIWSDDDGIVLKSMTARPCRNVSISNCVISSNGSGIKFGTESGGGYQNVTVNNCVIYDTRNSGIALQIVDGGTLDGVTISNIIMDNIKGNAITIRLGNRGRPYKEPNPSTGKLQNVIIDNIQGKRIGDWIDSEGRRVLGCHITGIPDYPVQNISISNINLQFKGGAAAEYASKKIPEFVNSYPSERMFGTMPAYGFYCRHVKNITFYNLKLQFEHDDCRPAMMFDDVQNLELSGLNAESTSCTEALIWLKQVKGAFIHGCFPTFSTKTFLRIDGEKSENITLTGNHLGNVTQVYVQGNNVKSDACYIGNNREQ